MVTKSDHISSILLLPFTVTVIIPAALLFLERGTIAIYLSSAIDLIRVFTGLVSILGGLFLLRSTIQLFVEKGEGTLAPWKPTNRLVVSGIYRYMRNPMITGVITILLGESMVFSSLYVFVWFVAFGALNHIYFIKSEEPALRKRFGKEYKRYCSNVPRWIPRRQPWIPEITD